MSLNNTSVRANVSLPTTPPPTSGTTTPPVTSGMPSNPSTDHKGDVLGNATMSAYNYVFKELPGRLTGALVPMPSDAQSRTPQLMASAHAQDVVEANRQSWDSAFWVKAGDALAAGFHGLGQWTLYVSDSLPPLNLGLSGAYAASTVPGPASLTEIEARLSRMFTTEKSQGLLTHEKKGKNPDNLIVWLTDSAHDNDAVRTRLNAAVRDLVKTARGDRVLIEQVNGALLSAATLEAKCGVTLSHCAAFKEPPESMETAKFAERTLKGYKDLLDWMGSHLPAADSLDLQQRMQTINFKESSNITKMSDTVTQFKLRVLDEDEMDDREEALEAVKSSFYRSVEKYSKLRSKSYLEQTGPACAALPLGAILVIRTGRDHYSDVRDTVMKSKQPYLVAHPDTKPLSKDEL